CVFCAGGFGTLNELFEVLTILQTKKVGKFPVILYGVEFWTPLKQIIKDFLRDKYELIDEDDQDIFVITDNEDEVLEIIKKTNKRDGSDALY
ncbi:MAG: TIGR00730 family Rossman fold protein, partial [Candidatus Moranbacteria bacterium]|nr:TIGR00730 family Rossman fold protein [Candidatus Moranbacteria bacterium]